MGLVSSSSTLRIPLLIEYRFFPPSMVVTGILAPILSGFNLDERGYKKSHCPSAF